jgi:hypothetical protein
LPDDTTVNPGHEYCGLSYPIIAEQKAHNRYVIFTSIMNSLRPVSPQSVHETLHSNLRCGIAEHGPGTAWPTG